MLHRKRLLFWLWTGALITALVLPAFAVTGSAVAQTAPSLDRYMNQWRHRVLSQQMDSDYAREAAWLKEWSAHRTLRPPVDVARQSQTVADWTVMVYVAADNNLEPAALMDLNEMEGVGSSPNVNIVAEVDRSAEYTDADGNWSGGRRLYIQQDQNTDSVTSPVIQDLGKIDSGDPNTLADFAIWTITNYPAQKYMLVLWDHGGAWISSSSDEDTGNDIDLPEMKGALDRIKTEAGIDKFEVLGFDMCLMGQMEVFETIAPYARYSVGSEESEPGPGWFYLFLDELVKNPSMDGAAVGKQVVDYFMYFLREVLGDQDVYQLASVDLSQGGPLVSALDQFTSAVRANPQAALSPIADARNNTISFGGNDDPQYFDVWSSIDLYRFAELLNGITSDPQLQAAAQGVMQAVNSFVLYQDHVTALDGSHGLAVYFPRTIKAYKIAALNEKYPVESPPSMASWVDFLNVFHGTATTTVTSAPGVKIIGTYPEVASIYQPAVVTLEVSGRDILRVNYAVTYIRSESERVVLDFDYLVSRTTTASGTDIVDWSDGVTTRTFTWEAEVPVLTDGQVSTYALLIPNTDNPGVAIVNGQYTSVRGGDPVKAQLVFDLNTRQSTALWGLNETASGGLQPFEIQVESGDKFQPLWLTLDANNQLSSSSFGDTLTLSSAQSITFQKVPAPSGQYSISFVAENVAGINNMSEALLQVSNDGLDPSLRGYTDLTYGVNFLYLSNWIRPRFTPDGKRLFTADLATNTVLSLYPYTDVTSAEETNAAIRASWNQLQDLQITQERQVTINELPAYVTDYTYTYNGEPRIGTVIAIYVPSQNVGYGFDLDAPVSNPGPAQQALQALVKSINFFQVQQATGQSSWQTITAANGLVSFPVPANWTTETSGNWTLYGPPDNKAVFVGISTQAASGQTNEQLGQFWVSQLQSGVQNLQIQASQPYYVGGRDWYLVVFTYDKDVKTAGAFFVTSASGQDYTFWIEAPDADFDQLYADIFAVTIGGFTFSGG
jgi:hypothetical protein